MENLPVVTNASF